MHYDHSTCMYFNRSTCIVSYNAHVQKKWGQGVASPPTVCPDNKQSMIFLSFETSENQLMMLWIDSLVQIRVGWGGGGGTVETKLEDMQVMDITSICFYRHPKRLIHRLQTMIWIVCYANPTLNI